MDHHFHLIGFHSHSPGRAPVLELPRKTGPFVDEKGQPLPGSISEKIHVEINGVEQGMFIKSDDISNPVLLFLLGVYDYTCSYPLAKSYFEQIHAPLKGYYTFEQSAHSPIFEEPEKVLGILQQDVMAGTNNLADPE